MCIRDRDTLTTASRKTRPNAAALVNHVKSVRTGNSSPMSLPFPAIAKPPTTRKAMEVWVSDPAIGAPLDDDIANFSGRTRERPREKKYRAAALWNATRAAISEVTNKQFAMLAASTE